MKRKVIFIALLLILCIAAVFLAPGLDKKIKVTYTHTDNPMVSYTGKYMKATNEEKFYYSAIECSSSAATAEFVDYRIENGVYIWEFKKESTVYGDVPDEKIKVVETEPVASMNHFVKGDSYLLFLLREESLFLSEPQYSSMGRVCINLDNIGEAYWHNGKLFFDEGTKAEDIIAYYKSMAISKGYVKNPYTIKNIKNSDLKTVIDESAAVYRVKVLGKSTDSILQQASLYEVEILDALKGKNYIATDVTGYLVKTKKNLLTVDNEYVITLSMVDNVRDKFSIFIQSADNGIIPIEDTETVEKVYEWLNLK